MTDLNALKRKYSWGPIPQWELDKLKPAEPEKPKRGRKPKETEETVEQ